MSISRSLKSVLALAICGVLSLAMGCQTTSNKLSAINPIKALSDDEIPTGVPDRVVATWSEAVLHKSGTGTRGFGGRLFFYDRNSETPLRVDGQLVVYAFAEDNRSKTDNKPTKRYVFPPQQFAKHESTSEVGVSYSVWLPWDSAGGQQSEVSLIARFEPSQGGGLVVSDQARQRLPGKPRMETMLADQPSPSRVEQTSFNTSVQVRDIKPAAAQQDAAKPRMTTTTISLPGRFKKAGTTTTSSQTIGGGSPADATASPNGTQPVKALQQTTAMQPVGDLQPTPFGTTVQYLTAGESVRRSVQPRSFGSTH